MIDKIINSINCEENLRIALPRFKEIFMRYYNEKYNDEIEELFNNNLFIAYQTPEVIELSINKLEILKTEQLVQEIIDTTDTNLNVIDIIKYYSYSKKEIQPMYQYIKFYKLLSMKKEGRRKQFIKEAYNYINKNIKKITEEEFEEMYATKKIPDSLQNIPRYLKNNIEYYLDENNSECDFNNLYTNVEELLKKVIPDITIDNCEDYLESEEIKKLNIIAEKYLEKMEEYNTFFEKLKPIYEEIERNKANSQKYKKELFKKFISQNMDLLKEDSREKVLRYISGEDRYLNDSYSQFLFGSGLFTETGLEAFKEEKDELLKSDVITTYGKNEIKRKRILYFKNNGIDLGDNYEDYINSEEVMKIWPAKDRVEQFLKTQQECQNEYNNKFYKETSHYIKTRKLLDDLGTLDKENQIDARLYSQKITCVSPNLVRKDGIYQLLSLVIINFDNYSNGSIDHNIVHELNHLFELYLSNVIGNTYEVTCGWEQLEGNIGEEQEENVDTITNDEKRKYELFNEIINELITIDIIQMMDEENIHIFDEEKSSKTNTTSYIHMLFLVKDFFKEYKDKIIESRHNGNINIIYDAVGKENFDELNSLFSIYNDNFSGMTIYRLLESLKNKEDNSLTRTYYELIDRKNEILERMREYNRESKKVNL